MFDEDLFKSKLNTRWLGHSLVYFEQVDSTNSYIRSLSSDNAGHGLVCLTDYQTQGRGQYKRRWMTEPGANLTFTLNFKPNKADRLHVLTLACALAASELAEEVTGQPSRLKWPNDIFAAGKKLGGLLTETIFTGSVLNRVMVGIGLNVNQRRFTPPLDATATSLSVLDGQLTFQREIVLAHLLERIEVLYQNWQRVSVDLVKNINRRLLGYGEWVQLQVDGRLKPGRSKFLGINEKGQMVVLTQDDEVETYSYEQIRILID